MSSGNRAHFFCSQWSFHKRVKRRDEIEMSDEREVKMSDEREV